MFGREKEIKLILGELDSQKSITLITGESGVGKSCLVEWLYSNFRNNSAFFLGFYDNEKSLAAESETFVYPFNIVLMSLIENIKESESRSEKLHTTVKKLRNTLLTFSKESGIEIAEALVHDIVKKAGLEQTIFLFLKKFREQKTSVMATKDFLEHREGVLLSYLGIFRSLSQEFNQRHFILLFDQIESAGKSAIDFILNFAKLMPNKFHILIAYKTEERGWENYGYRKMFEDTRAKLVYDLGAKELKLEGISAEAIGDWIKSAKNIRLPMVPDLTRIRENSAGLPILLKPWIDYSSILDYRELNAESLCEQLLKIPRGLTDEDKIRLNKMSILRSALSLPNLGPYLQVNEVDYLSPFIDRLVERGIFHGTSRWFRHELIKRCFEESIEKETKRRYHTKAADDYFLLKKGSSSLNKMDTGRFNIEISYGYHLFHAKNHEKSFDQNREVGELAVELGDLDLAERCFTMARSDANSLGHLEDEIYILSLLSTTVYRIWGRYDEALEYLDKCLKYFRSENEEEMITVTLTSIGEILTKKGKHDEALKVFEENLVLSRKIKSDDMISVSLNGIGSIYTKKGRHDEALKNYEESLEIARKLGQDYLVAMALNNIGTIYLNKGEYDEALKKFEESLLMVKKTPEDLDLKIMLPQNIATIHMRLGHYDEALKKYEESLEIARKLGDQANMSMILNNMGTLHRNNKAYDEALKKYEESLEIARKLGDQALINNTLINIGSIHFVKKDYDASLKKFEEGMVLSKTLGNETIVVWTLGNIAAIYDLKHEEDKAIMNYDHALSLSMKLSDDVTSARLLLNIAMIHDRRKEFEDALKSYEESLQLKRKLKDIQGVAGILYSITTILCDKGRYDEALPLLEETLEIAKGSGNEADIGIASYRLGTVLRAKGENDEALKNYEESLEMAKRIGNKPAISEINEIITRMQKDSDGS